MACISPFLPTSRLFKFFGRDLRKPACFEHLVHLYDFVWVMWICRFACLFASYKWKTRNSQHDNTLFYGFIEYRWHMA